MKIIILTFFISIFTINDLTAQTFGLQNLEHLIQSNEQAK